MEFSPGINLMIGDNGTGKTHILKLIYTPLAALYEKKRVSDKIRSVFLPAGRIGRLVKRARGSGKASVRVFRNRKTLSLTIATRMTDTLKWRNGWTGKISPCVYIPVKEMLANAPGFVSLYDERVIHFEEVYRDIIHKALLPVLKGPIAKDRKPLLDMLREAFVGTVVQKSEQFYLKSKQGELEFTLLAEGTRKFALLWLLIQNGTLLKGSTLFWDEPEANINPSMIRTLVEILLHLQRQGIQIFIATHSYVVLKEFELQRGKKDSIRFFSLKRDKSSGEIRCTAGDDYGSTMPNKISDAFTGLYDREVERALGAKK